MTAKAADILNLILYTRNPCLNIFFSRFNDTEKVFGNTIFCQQSVLNQNTSTSIIAQPYYQVLNFIT